MRIAVVSPSFLPSIGGAEFVAHHLARNWSMNGHEVCVMNAISDQPPENETSYNVKRFTILRGSTRFGYHRFPFSGYATRQLDRLISDYKPDFISAHFGYPTGVWLSRISRLPTTLVTCHGRELTKFDWGYRSVHGIDSILARALNSLTRSVAISTHARKLMEELGVVSNKIVDIPNGVEWGKFQEKATFDLRKKLQLPRDAIVVLTVGRQHQQKDYETGLRAFAQLAAGTRGVYYVILGRGTACWQRLAEELGVSTRVRLCEGLHGIELIGAYQQADVFFSPSIWEMFPLVVIEAMAAGLPAVVTNISGSQDAVKTNVNGIIVEPRQPGQMAEALGRLTADAGVRHQMGQASRELAERYDWRHISRMYIDCVKSNAETA